MPQTFNIKAGSIALEHIQKKGLSPDDISVIPAAAGGPKWIALYAFDKYLLANWFHNRTSPLHLVGASAGAWRMACYSLKDADSAMDRFLKNYVEQRYTVMPSPEEVTQELESIIANVLGENGTTDLLEERMMKLYIISALTKFKGRASGNYKNSFIWLIIKNTISRRLIESDMERIVFTNAANHEFIQQDNFPTTHINFTETNMIPALRSTGSIPLMTTPVTSISQKPGLIWDGALVDYHIGLDYHTDGLVFYPHFAPNITEGWFDKFIPWRKFKGSVLDKMILVYPSQKFVQTLPDSKIPDRKDFETYMNDNDKRIRNWYEVAERGKEMAAEFDEYWKAGKLGEVVEPM